MSLFLSRTSVAMPSWYPKKIGAALKKRSIWTPFPALQKASARGYRQIAQIVLLPLPGNRANRPPFPCPEHFYCTSRTDFICPSPRANTARLPISDPHSKTQPITPNTPCSCWLVCPDSVLLKPGKNLVKTEHNQNNLYWITVKFR